MELGLNKLSRREFNFNEYIFFKLKDNKINIIEKSIIKSDGWKSEIIVENDFKMTKDVKERMDLLCGATNYSLALRNSEHAARYALVLHKYICYVYQDSMEKKL